MEEINLLIARSFDAIGLILVFVFVLFDIKHPRIQDLLGKTPPPRERSQEFADHRQNLRSSLLLDALPLVIVNGAMAYLFIPLAARVLAQYRIDLWSFDFTQTAFLFVVCFIVWFFVWAAWLFLKLASRLSQVSRAGKTH